MGTASRGWFRDWLNSPQQRCARVGFSYEATEKEVLRHCPACESPHLEPFGDTDRYGFRVSTVLCVRCGLVFINPRMTVEEYGRFYASGNYRSLIGAFKGKSAGKHPGVPPRLVKLTEVLRQSLPAESPIRVLDVGGTRSVYELMARALPISKYVCINPSPDEIDIVEDQHKRIVVSTIEEYQPGDARYDLICLMGTLSHLLSPAEAFMKIGAMLSERGVFAFDFSDRVSRMRLLAHPSLAIQVDHPMLVTSAAVNHLLARAHLCVRRTLQESPRGCMLLASRGNSQPPPSVDQAILSDLRTAAAHMRTPVPPTSLLRVSLRGGLRALRNVFRDRKH